LKWIDLQLAHADSPGLPQTSERVWLSPRGVQSAVITANDEAEKYLFYRGVAHLDAPLVVQQQKDRLTVSVRKGETLLAQFPPSWLVRVLPDGRVWHRALPLGEVRNGRITLPLPRDDIGAARGNLDALRRELENALIAQGLFADEARAMLETWQLSYFASEGERVFFLLPQAWTDTHLPLSISVPSDVTRVMMGRIELISARQRAALEQLQGLPAEAFDLPPVFVSLMNETAGLSGQDQVERQRKVLRLLEDRDRSHAALYEEFGLEVPAALRLYDSLGRFRDALLGHEWRSAQDEATRQRLMQIIGTFSACLPPIHDESRP
jgi:hypothetical protein